MRPLLQCTHQILPLLALSLCALLLTVAPVAAQGVDADLRLGERFAGAIDLVGDEDVLRFTAMEGERISLLVAGSKKTGLVPNIELLNVSLEPPEEVIPLTGPAGKAPKVVVKKLDILTHGVYELHITGADDTTGTYKVRTKGAKATHKPAASSSPIDAGKVLAMDFAARAGSTFRAIVKPAKGSSAVVGAITLAHETQGDVDLTGLVTQLKAGKTRVGDVMLPWFGRYTLSIVNDGPSGAFDIKATVKGKFKKRSWVELAFGGELVITPEALFIGENDNDLVTGMIGLPDLSKAPVSVALMKDIEGLPLPFEPMVDNGDLAEGDEIEGDRVYTVRFAGTALQEGFGDYHALVNVKKNIWARSHPVTVLLAVPLADAEIDQVIADHEALQDMVDQAALDETLDVVLPQILAQLEADPSVDEVGMTEGGLGIWIVYECGIPALLYAPEAEEKGPAHADGSGDEPRVASALPPDLEGGEDGRLVPYPPYDAYTPKLEDQATIGGWGGSENGVGTYFAAAKGADPFVVGSNKVRAIAAQYFDWGENDDIPKIAKKLEDTGCFEVEYSKATVKYGGSLDWFKDLGDYGIVLISTHGDSCFQSLSKKWKARFKYEGKGSQVVLHSSARVTTASIQSNRVDLLLGRLVLWGRAFGVMPSFIRRHAGTMPKSLVYSSACRSTWDATMANAFLARGALAYVGYDDYVAVSFCVSHGPPMFDTLLMSDKTLGDAYEIDIEPAVKSSGKVDEHRAIFEMFGTEMLRLDPHELKDGSFESGNVNAGWTTDGDARSIGALGSWLPTDGSRMAIISTGLGFTTSSGSIAQKICLSDDAVSLAWDWNFFSEEFLEWCGSIFQDTFQVTLQLLDEDGNPVGSPIIVENVRVDDLCGPPSIDADGYTVYKNPKVKPSDLSFDKGDVYTTGWKTTVVKIPENMKGERILLVLEAYDVGDSIYDTAILIDDVLITTK